MNANIFKAISVTALLITAEQPVFSQPFFVNLDFETPVLPLVPDIEGKVIIAQAMPGWSGYIGGNPEPRAFYNTRSIDAAAISFQGPGSLITPIQGNYSLFLQGPSRFAPQISAAIAQTGQIPLNASSLRFIAAPWSLLQVTFGAQTIPLIQLAATANFVTLGGDISAFVGQTSELRFTTPIPGGGIIDDVHFSSEPIPEPSVILQLTVGLAAAGLSRRWRRQRT